MDNPAMTLLALWREANHRAFEAESLLYKTSLEHKAGRGPAPTAESRDEARLRRTEAGELFQRLMAQTGGDLTIFASTPPDEHSGH